MLQRSRGTRPPKPPHTTSSVLQGLIWLVTPVRGLQHGLHITSHQASRQLCLPSRPAHRSQHLIRSTQGLLGLLPGSHRAQHFTAAQDGLLMLHTMLQQHCCRGTLTTAQELGQLCWNGPAGVATYGLVTRSRVAWNRRCMLMSRPPRGVVFQCSRAQNVDQVVARRGGGGGGGAGKVESKDNGTNVFR